MKLKENKCIIKRMIR